MSKSYEKHIKGNTVFLCSMSHEEKKEYFWDMHGINLDAQAAEMAAAKAKHVLDKGMTLEHYCTDLHKAMTNAGWFVDTRWINGRWRDVYVTERPLWLDGITRDWSRNMLARKNFADHFYHRHTNVGARRIRVSERA